MSFICSIGWVIAGPYIVFAWIVTKLLNLFPNMNIPIALGMWICILLSVLIIYAVIKYFLFRGAVGLLGLGDYLSKSGKLIMGAKKVFGPINNLIGLVSALIVLFFVRILFAFESCSEKNDLPGIPDLDQLKEQTVIWMDKANAFLSQNQVFFYFRFIIFPLMFFGIIYFFMRELSIFRKKWINFALAACLTLIFSFSPVVEYFAKFLLSNVLYLIALFVVFFLLWNSWKLLMRYENHFFETRFEATTISTHLTVGFFFVLIHGIIGAILGLVFWNGNYGIGSFFGFGTGIILFSLAKYQFYVLPFKNKKFLIKEREKIDKEIQKYYEKERSVGTQTQKEVYSRVIDALNQKRILLSTKIDGIEKKVRKIQQHRWVK